jgi:hypothetical protein
VEFRLFLLFVFAEVVVVVVVSTQQPFSFSLFFSFLNICIAKTIYIENLKQNFHCFSFTCGFN